MLRPSFFGGGSACTRFPPGGLTDIRRRASGPVLAAWSRSVFSARRPTPLSFSRATFECFFDCVIFSEKFFSEIWPGEGASPAVVLRRSLFFRRILGLEASVALSGAGERSYCRLQSHLNLKWFFPASFVGRWRESNVFPSRSSPEPGGLGFLVTLLSHSEPPSSYTKSSHFYAYIVHHLCFCFIF